MVRSRTRRARRALVTMLTVGAVLTGIPVVGQAHAAATIDPTVGPLFQAGLSADHTCTASVLSAGDGLLLTAAHCISGSGAGVQFVPGYDGTAADPTPYGVWVVTRSWVDPTWRADQDEQHDVAILQVADRKVDGVDRPIAAVTGGNELGLILTADLTVSVPAYPAGLGDAPLSCTTRTYYENGFPGFDCPGYVGGTSGAPWLVGTSGRRTVVGVVGGWHQGGCESDTSYSSAFTPGLLILLLRALFGLPADDLPAPGGDGC